MDKEAVYAASVIRRAKAKAERKGLTKPKRGFNMKGYKTIAANLAAIMAVIAVHYGLDVPPEMWEAGILAVMNLGLRFVTSGPVFNKDK